jgi:acyl-CoA thioesterase-1
MRVNRSGAPSAAQSLSTVASFARRVLLVFFALALLPGASATSAESRRVILVLGDSLSTAYGIDVEKSWVSLLQKRLRQSKPDYRVVNASISGETTRGGVARVAGALAADAPEIVIVELGGNDGLRGIDLETTRRNLETIVGNCLEAGAEVLLLAMDLPPNYGPSFINGFRSIYTRIAEQDRVKLVPFFLEGVAGDPALMQADGIHPQAEAQPKLLDNVWLYLEPLLAG